MDTDGDVTLDEISPGIPALPPAALTMDGAPSAIAIPQSFAPLRLEGRSGQEVVISGLPTVVPDMQTLANHMWDEMTRKVDEIHKLNIATLENQQEINIKNLYAQEQAMRDQANVAVKSIQEQFVQEVVLKQEQLTSEKLIHQAQLQSEFNAERTQLLTMVKSENQYMIDAATAQMNTLQAQLAAANAKIEHTENYAQEQQKYIDGQVCRNAQVESFAAQKLAEGANNEENTKIIAQSQVEQMRNEMMKIQMQSEHNRLADIERLNREANEKMEGLRQIFENQLAEERRVAKAEKLELKAILDKSASGLDVKGRGCEEHNISTPRARRRNSTKLRSSLASSTLSDGEDKNKEFTLGGRDAAKGDSDASSDDDLSSAADLAAKTTAAVNVAVEANTKVADIKLGPMPNNPMQWRQYYNNIKDQVHLATNHIDEAWIWISELDDPKKTFEDFADSGNFRALDAKLQMSLYNRLQGELLTSVSTIKEEMGRRDPPVLIRGRQILWKVQREFAISKVDKHIFSMQDFLLLKMRDNNLSNFMTEWDRVVSAIATDPGDGVKEAKLISEIGKHSSLAIPLASYNALEHDSPLRGYKNLYSTVQRTLENRKIEKNRLMQSDALEKGKGQGNVHSIGTETKPKVICRYWKSGKCKNGDTCKYSHSGPKGGRDAANGKGRRSKERDSSTSSRNSSVSSRASSTSKGKGKKQQICRSWNSTGTCKFEKECRFAHKGPCNAWVKEGKCKFGDKCIFQHIVKNRGTRVHAARSTSNSSTGSSSSAQPRGRSRTKTAKGKKETAVALVNSVFQVDADPVGD